MYNTNEPRKYNGSFWNYVLDNFENISLEEIENTLQKLFYEYAMPECYSGCSKISTVLLFTIDGKSEVSMLLLSCRNVMNTLLQKQKCQTEADRKKYDMFNLYASKFEEEKLKFTARISEILYQ